MRRTNRRDAKLIKIADKISNIRARIVLEPSEDEAWNSSIMSAGPSRWSPAAAAATRARRDRLTKRWRRSKASDGADTADGARCPKIKRSVYADMFGPTTGDKVRLADTDLIIEVEKDFTTYGEEVKFGGGKVIRDGMGQSQATNKQGAADTVITNALIVDHWGIVKADVAIKEGMISAPSARPAIPTSSPASPS